VKTSDAPTALLQLMAGVAQGKVDGLPDWLQRGEIGEGLALVVGRLTFPAGSWRQNELFTLPDPIATTAGGDHSHTIPRPALLRPLEAGDAVVVGLYLDGSEPIVLCRDVGTP
jgi:hypothetical protein